MGHARHAILAATILCASALGQAAETNYLLDRLVSNALRIESLECSYTHERWNGSYSSPKPSEFFFRFAGTRRYQSEKLYPAPDDDSGIAFKLTIAARKGNLVSHLGYSLNDNGEYVRAPNGNISTHWPSEYDTLWLTPHYLWGLFDGNDAHAQFERGEFHLVKRGDNHVLVQLLHPEDTGSSIVYRFDYYFDSSERLVRVVKDYALVNDSEAGGILLAYEQELENPWYVLELSEHHRIGGVEFPLRGDLAQHSKSVETPGEVVERCTLVVQPDSVKINPTLEASDFEIVYPKGTFMVDTIADTAYFVGDGGVRYMNEFAAEVLDALSNVPQEPSNSESGEPASGTLETTVAPASATTKALWGLLFVSLAAALSVSLILFVGNVRRSFSPSSKDTQ